MYVSAATENIPIKDKLLMSLFKESGNRITPAIGALTISLNSKDSRNLSSFEGKSYSIM